MDWKLWFQRDVNGIAMADGIYNLFAKAPRHTWELASSTDCCRRVRVVRPGHTLNPHFHVVKDTDLIQAADRWSWDWIQIRNDTDMYGTEKLSYYVFFSFFFERYCNHRPEEPVLQCLMAEGESWEGPGFLGWVLLFWYILVHGCFDQDWSIVLKYLHDRTGWCSRTCFGWGKVCEEMVTLKPVTSTKIVRVRISHIKVSKSETLISSNFHLIPMSKFEDFEGSHGCCVGKCRHLEVLLWHMPQGVAPPSWRYAGHSDIERHRQTRIQTDMHK